MPAGWHRRGQCDTAGDSVGPAHADGEGGGTGDPLAPAPPERCPFPCRWSRATRWHRRVPGGSTSCRVTPSSCSRCGAGSAPPAAPGAPGAPRSSTAPPRQVGSAAGPPMGAICQPWQGCPGVSKPRGCGTWGHGAVVAMAVLGMVGLDVLRVFPTEQIPRWLPWVETSHRARCREGSLSP